MRFLPKIAIAIMIMYSWIYVEAEYSSDIVELVRLKYGGGGDWYNGPTELPNLAKFVRENCGINAIATGKYVEILDKNFFAYPFIFVTGHGDIKFTEREIQRLREFLSAGGFLFVNDDYGLDQSFRREIKRVFPDKELIELPFDHPIYHCFYDFPNGLPKIHEHDNKPPRGYGIFINNRLAIFYAYESDIADGWDDPDVHNDPPEKREAALKMGANILIYVLTH